MEGFKDNELWAQINDALSAARPENLYYPTVPLLFTSNLARGRGYFASLIISKTLEECNDTQIALFASLVSVVNSKVPIVGQLVLFKAISLFQNFVQSGCSLRDPRKNICTLIVHLCNQGVCGEVLPLEVLLLLLETSKSQLGVSNPQFAFVVELMYKLGNHMCTRPGLSSALDSVFEALQEQERPGGTQVEELKRARQTNFALFPAIPPLLNILCADAQICHEVSLDDAVPEAVSNFDFCTLLEPNTTRAQVLAQDNEWEKYQQDFLNNLFQLEEEQPISQLETPLPIVDPIVKLDDRTSKDVVEIRKRIYLTINHSLSFEQVAHELLTQRKRGKILFGHDNEIVQMLVEFCAQQKAYTDFVGLLSCRLSKTGISPELFEKEFARIFENIHLTETTKMRNYAMLLSQMLFTESLDWVRVFSMVKLDEEMTSSSSRIFLKFLFQRLAQLLGMDGLQKRLTPLENFPGLFPKSSKRARQVRFAVNFFTSIGLGNLTVQMREWLERGLAREDSDSESLSSSSSSEREARKKSKKKKSKKKKSRFAE